jgi:hypothetical protein
LPQTSSGGTHAPDSVQAAVQVVVPVEPQVVVQDALVPAQQAKSSSHRVSQSSSRPLHVSAGRAHSAPGVQLAEQLRLPVEPHEVVQGPRAFAQHPNPSSHVVSQSSSIPLHVSAGGAQVLG